MLKKLTAAAVVAGLALLTFRGFLTPDTAVGDRVETGLEYVTLAQFIGQADAAEVTIVLFDEGPFAVDPAWYVIADPQPVSDHAFGMRAGALAQAGGALACKDGGVLKGKLIWMMQGDQVTKGHSVCERRQLDIARLVDAAALVRDAAFLQLIADE